MCPQQNVLFSYLTVKEHLELYAAVKGVPKHSLALVVDDMVMSLGLKDKTETRAACLSGGMQRKLQVFIRNAINCFVVFFFHDLLPCFRGVMNYTSVSSSKIQRHKGNASS